MATADYTLRFPVDFDEEAEIWGRTAPAAGQLTLVRRRLEGRWLDTPTAYDAAGNVVATSTLTGTNDLLTSRFRYDALGRVAAQTADPTNVDHEVAFTYEGEGAQLTRVDLRQTAGPTAGACGEAGITCMAARTTTNVYNPDATLASSVATDEAGRRLVSCHYASGTTPISGYDADRHLLATRTLTTGSCSDDTAASAVATRTMAYDQRGLLGSMTQAVRSPETGQLVARSQSFTHRSDATIATATHDGRTTAYTRSPVGWVQSMLDWRNVNSTMDYSPAGAPVSSSLGPVLASTRTYHGDGSASSLVWRSGVTQVRAHTAMAYDVGGLRIAEEVSASFAAGTLGYDTGGPASYRYDLAGRLASYTSAFRLPGDATEPTTTYGLDDGANIVSATTTAGGLTRRQDSSSYPGGRLAARRTVATP
ncbi:MAG: hypothetical protein ACRDZW_00465, partial [Acidimicrobiales bacterium]